MKIDLCLPQDATDSENENYLRSIQQDGRIFLIGSPSKHGYFLRIVMFEERLRMRDIEHSVKVLKELADVMNQESTIPSKKEKNSIIL